MLASRHASIIFISYAAGAFCDCLDLKKTCVFAKVLNATKLVMGNTLSWLLFAVYHEQHAIVKCGFLTVLSEAWFSALKGRKRITDCICLIAQSSECVIKPVLSFSSCDEPYNIVHIYKSKLTMLIYIVITPLHAKPSEYLATSLMTG